MRLILVRHGETPWNKEGRFQGQTHVGLSPLGERQSHAVAKALLQLKPVAVYASPLPRTLAMAEAIAGELSIPINLVDDLKEMHLGELEGVTGQEMRMRYAELYAMWRRDPSSVVMPAGESLQQVQERVWKVIEGIAHNHPEQIVAAVSHNFAIRTILCRFLGLPLSKFHMLRVGLASVSILEFNGPRSYLVAYNDCCHLKGIMPEV